MGIPGRRPSATGAGFTLVELVLTVALLLLLAGAVGYSFNSARQGTQLEEGAGQLESLFRFARAQSASTGRRVQVSFVEAAFGGGSHPATPFTRVPPTPPRLFPGSRSSGSRIRWWNPASSSGCSRRHRSPTN
jgi:type II secretory pathway pseudopilin PulG